MTASPKGGSVVVVVVVVVVIVVVATAEVVVLTLEEELPPVVVSSSLQAQKSGSVHAVSRLHASSLKIFLDIGGSFFYIGLIIALSFKKCKGKRKNK